MNKTIVCLFANIAGQVIFNIGLPDHGWYIAPFFAGFMSQFSSKHIKVTFSLKLFQAQPYWLRHTLNACFPQYCTKKWSHIKTENVKRVVRNRLEHLRSHTLLR